MNQTFRGGMRRGADASRHHRCSLFRLLKSHRCKYDRKILRKSSIIMGSASPGASHPICCNPPKRCKQQGWISCTKPEQGVSKPSADAKSSLGRLNALPLSVAAVAAWSQSLPAQFSAILSRGIVGATVKASIKLGLICCIVGWLLQHKKLPKDTSLVLSKVCFNLCIPCLLFTRISQTLASTQDVMLLWIPAACALQIFIGWVVGLGAAKLLEKGAFFLPKDPNRKLVTPTRAAPAIAASTAVALGNPMAAPGLVPKASKPPAGLSALVTISCMFGNSLTIPLLFMLSMLPAAMAGPCTAYVALFLICWSPFFWTFGANIVRNAEDPNEGMMKGMARYGGPLMPADMKKSIPVGFHESSTSAPTSGSFVSGDSMAITPLPIAHRVLPSLAAILDKATRKAKQIFSPPFVGILSGCIVGFSPLGRALFTPNGAQEMASWTTTQGGAAVVNLIVSSMKCMVETMVMFGEATVSIGAIVLASSLFADDKSKQEKDGSSESQSLIRLLIPEDVFERRALVLVSLGRFVAVPIGGLISVMALSALGVLPSDPVCRLSILIQSTMPPAQNLTVMMNLSDHTRELVPVTAKFLMRMYFLSLIGPAMIWTIIFAMFTGVQLA